ncbi:MAG TPA: hypothetical protein VFS20_15775 [Longimicrobium sp.]|nr:hypothetical protein [Longimicrobium sp.]
MIGGDAGSRAREAYATFCNDLVTLGSRTNAQAQALWVGYVRTLQEPTPSSAAAYGNTQREYARLSTEYARSAQQIYRTYHESLREIAGGERTGSRS